MNKLLSTLCVPEAAASPPLMVRAARPAGGQDIPRAALTRFVVVLVLLLAAYLSLDLLGGEAGRDLANWAGPASLAAAGLWTAYRTVAANRRTIWTPVPWFAASAALFYGVGPLAYVFGSDEAVAHMNRFWEVRPDDLWRTNVLNAVGLLTITATLLIADRLLGRRPASPVGHVSNVPAGIEARWKRAPQVRRLWHGGEVAALVTFLGVGLPLRYLLVLPYEFAQLDFVLPGSIFVLDCLVYLGLFLLAYLAAKGGGAWRAGFWVLFVNELAVGLVRFNKEAFLLALIMTALGRYLAGRRVAGLVILGAVAFALYVAVSPLVAWGRMQIARETGAFNRAPLDLRLTVAARGLELWSRGQLEVEESEQQWWKRLCYVNAQTAAMHLYDAGEPGDSFLVVLYGWVPRFLWPDKPVITPGEDFTQLVLGEGGSSTGIGVFGEAYWVGGWPAVVLACGYVGGLFAWLSRQALGMLARSEWLVLPCAFMGIRLGLRTDDWFFTGYVNGMLIYLAYYFLIRLMVSSRNGTWDASIPSI